MEDGMAWDQIEFWETRHDVGCGETIREISEKEKLLYDKTRNELSAKLKIKAAIEAKSCDDRFMTLRFLARYCIANTIICTHSPKMHCVMIGNTLRKLPATLLQ